MCYHYHSPDASKLAKQMHSGYKATDFPARRLNGFSHPETIIITDNDPDLITVASWGLVPFFAKDKSDFLKKSNTLNCMIETAPEKPSFRNYTDNRCLVLASAFYEWKWLDVKGKEKQQYQISDPSSEIFAMAGIWSDWKNPSSGEVTKTFSILTTAANTLMAEIHNNKKRMPVVLSQAEQNLWLRREKLEPYHSRSEIELTAIPIY